MSKIYFTLTGTNHYFGKEFLKKGAKIRLEKEPDNEYDKEAIKVTYEGLIKNAEKSVVMTGYSISDYFTGMLDTIIAKSQQGVYVRFYVNDIEKSRASLVKMLAYRSKYLQFFEYEKNSDDKMAASHAKILTIDSDKSLVSSANLSYHGLSGNIEMGFLVRSADKAKQIEELLKELVRMHVYKKIS